MQQVELPSQDMEPVPAAAPAAEPVADVPAARASSEATAAAAADSTASRKASLCRGLLLLVCCIIPILIFTLPEDPNDIGAVMVSAC